MQTKYIAIALRLVQEMEGDTGCVFDPPVERWTELIEGVARMWSDGCAFTDEQYDSIANAQATPLLPFDGAVEVDNALDEIFEPGIAAQRAAWAEHTPQCAIMLHPDNADFGPCNCAGDR